VAKKVATAAMDEARKNNWVPVVVLVTDWSGSLVYLERMDGTLYAGVDVAIKKARSAAAYRRSTKDFADLLAQGGLGNRFLVLPHAMPVDGGLPIVIDGKIVGAIGVSGVTAPQEGQIAAAGLAALKWACLWIDIDSEIPIHSCQPKINQWGTFCGRGPRCLESCRRS